MKVSELTGAHLALWVARALKLEEPEIVDSGNGEGPCCLYVHHYEEGDDGWWEPFSPHKNWAQGGPILAHLMATSNWQIEPWDDKHGIAPGCKVCVTNFADNGDAYDSYYEAIGGHSMPRFDFLTPDVLTAVCRAFVAHHYGAEVPDEVAS